MTFKAFLSKTKHDFLDQFKPDGQYEPYLIVVAAYAYVGAYFFLRAEWDDPRLVIFLGTAALYGLVFTAHFPTFRLSTHTCLALAVARTFSWFFE